MKKIFKRLSNLKNNPFEEASEDHLSSLDEIIERIEDTEEDISDDTHADGVDEDPDLLISELEDLEHHKGSADTDLSFTEKTNPPDEIAISDILTQLGHTEDLPLPEEEDDLQEILSAHESPENMILPDEDTQGDETESFISDESPAALTEEPESELELGRQMQPSGDDGTSMISVSSDKKDENAESIWKDEMNSPTNIYWGIKRISVTNINWGIIGVFLAAAFRFQGKRKIRRQLILYKNLLKTYEPKGREGLFQANKIVNFDSSYNQRTRTILRGYFNRPAFKEFPNPAVLGITYQIEFFENFLENPGNYFR